MDVHAETISVAVAEPDGEVRPLRVIPNREEPIRRLIRKLGDVKQLRACYEAGPTGYVLYWQLTALGVQCDVIAPTLVPVKTGDPSALIYALSQTALPGTVAALMEIRLR
jgi:transposase